jgi:hypothetical protein
MNAKGQTMAKVNAKAAALEAARKTLGLETLETRSSDSLDFSDQAVWRLKEALEAAFEAGRAHGVAKGAFSDR